MARVDIPVQQLANFGVGLSAPTWTAADAALDHSFINDGRTILLMKNTNAAAKTATIISVADDHGRTGDLTVTCALTVGFSVKGPFHPQLFNQPGGVVHVDGVDLTDCSFMALRLPQKDA